MTTKTTTTATTATAKPKSRSTRTKAPAKPDKGIPIKSTPSYQFPCVRGIQSGCEYYTTMIPVRLLTKLFVLESEEMPAEMRAQRKLNVSRVHKLKDYVLSAKNYTLSAVTVTVDVPNDQTEAVHLQSDTGRYRHLERATRFALPDRRRPAPH